MTCGIPHGGEFVAARNVIVGARDVARFVAGITRFDPADVRAELRSLNGLPALVIELAHTHLPRQAARFVICVEVSDASKILGIHGVLATRKLRGLRFLT